MTASTLYITGRMHAAEAEGRLTWLARHLQPRPPAQHTGAGLRPAEAVAERDNEWRRPGERRTCAFWAAEAGEEEARINLGGRKGFFSAVVAAYNNHWLLRTQPGDWWSVVRDKKTFHSGATPLLRGCSRKNIFCQKIFDNFSSFQATEMVLTSKWGRIQQEVQNLASAICG